jgi:hypothetical protein
MTYTVVDDTHFFYAGLKPQEIYGSYLTEKQGQTLNLLATPMIMRYLIPFKPVDEVMAHLRAMEKDGRRVAVYGDDGEKFGLWPGTHEWVIKKGWLEKLFTSISHSSDWLRTVLPGDFVASTRPLGRVYLPQASYEEMTEWALPVEQGQTLEDMIAALKDDGRWEEWRPFVRGGTWDNFLVKYEEANRMHKKMVFLSEKVAQVAEAQKFLWRSQCNCAYWHGVFGGLYLGHLRRAVHENLIRAQSHLLGKTGNGIEMLQLDLDKDGAEEVLVWGPNLSLGLDPARGGGLFEICHLPRALNLSDTLTRRPEAYHRLLYDLPQDKGDRKKGINSIHELAEVNAKDLERFLVFDSYTRASLLDHFLDPQTRVKDYAANDYAELGDFVQGQYLIKQAQVSSGKALVELTRTGRVGPKTLTVKKTVRTGEDARVTLDYEFECRDHGAISTLYGCEFNLTLYSDQDQERYYLVPESDKRYGVAETGGEEDLARFELVNGPDQITATFTFSRYVSVWFFPLMTVSKSENGFERIYQGSSLLFLYPLNLVPGQKDRLQIELQIIDSSPIPPQQRIRPIKRFGELSRFLPKRILSKIRPSKW